MYDLRIYQIRNSSLKKVLADGLTSTFAIIVFRSISWFTFNFEFQSASFSCAMSNY